MGLVWFRDSKKEATTNSIPDSHVTVGTWLLWLDTAPPNLVIIITSHLSLKPKKKKSTTVLGIIPIYLFLKFYFRDLNFTNFFHINLSYFFKKFLFG